MVLCLFLWSFNLCVDSRALCRLSKFLFLYRSLLCATLPLKFQLPKPCPNLASSSRLKRLLFCILCLLDVPKARNMTEPNLVSSSLLKYCQPALLLSEVKNQLFHIFVPSFLVEHSTSPSPHSLTPLWHRCKSDVC